MPQVLYPWELVIYILQLTSIMWSAANTTVRLILLINWLAYILYKFPGCTLEIFAFWQESAMLLHLNTVPRWGNTIPIEPLLPKILRCFYKTVEVKTKTNSTTPFLTIQLPRVEKLFADALLTGIPLNHDTIHNSVLSTPLLRCTAELKAQYILVTSFLIGCYWCNSADLR